MNRIILFLLVLSPLLGVAQTEPPVVQGSRYYEFKHTIRVDSGLILPRADTFFTRQSLKAPGDMRWRPADSTLYYFKGDKWLKVGTGVYTIPPLDSVTKYGKISLRPIYIQGLEDMFTSPQPGIGLGYDPATRSGILQVRTAAGTGGRLVVVADSMEVNPTVFLNTVPIELPASPGYYLSLSANSKVIKDTLNVAAVVGLQDSLNTRNTKNIYNSNGTITDPQRTVTVATGSSLVVKDAASTSFNLTLSQIGAKLTSGASTKYTELDQNPNYVQLQARVTGPTRRSGIIADVDSVQLFSAGLYRPTLSLNDIDGTIKASAGNGGSNFESYMRDNGIEWGTRVGGTYTQRAKLFPDATFQADTIRANNRVTVGPKMRISGTLTGLGVEDNAGNNPLFVTGTSTYITGNLLAEAGNYTFDMGGLGNPRNFTLTNFFNANQQGTSTDHFVKIDPVSGRLRYYAASAVNLQTVTDAGNKTTNLVQITGANNTPTTGAGLSLSAVGDTGIVRAYNYATTTGGILKLNDKGGRILTGASTDDGVSAMRVDGRLRAIDGLLEGDINAERQLTIRNTSTGTGAYSWVRFDNGTNSAFMGLRGINNAAGYSFFLYGNGMVPLTLHTNDMERMRITATGQVGIWTANPTSTFHVQGSVSNSLRTVTTTTTVSDTDYYINLNNSSNIVINLPSASGITGRTYTFKKISNNANTVTITPASGNIDAAATLVLGSYMSGATIYTDGTNWFIKN